MTTVDDPDFLIYDEDRISREDTRAKCVTWFLAGVGIGILSALWVTDAAAHTAPTGWEYSQICCSNRDCAPIPDSAVKETNDGYQITLMPGQHPMVKDKVFQATIPYNSGKLKDSPDGMYHACILSTGHVMCFYRGPRGF